MFALSGSIHAAPKLIDRRLVQRVPPRAISTQDFPRRNIASAAAGGYLRSRRAGSDRLSCPRSCGPIGRVEKRIESTCVATVWVSLHACCCQARLGLRFLVVKVSSEVLA